MSLPTVGLAIFCLFLIGFVGCSDTGTPTPSSFKISDPNLTMELVASSSEIQTPIGLAIDSNDNLYVLESHTHTPPNDYQGPAYDRIKKGIDEGDDGVPDKWVIYADSLEDGMNLAIGKDQELYVTTKNSVLSFRDLNGDGISDSRTLLLDMVEPENVYDHAGILGITTSSDGYLYVSRGNTGGQYWRIEGTDGTIIEGYGDGGNVMRCRLDGSKLEEIATGFWNPFDIKFSSTGRLLLTDNDPDSRGPNRLIEVVNGGDYGYKTLYGGSGIHPYASWNGELPGTLPYAAPLGEAPCGLLDGAMTNFGQNYQNDILVNIWEEKNIVRIPMSQTRSSVSGNPEILVQGDSTFHPVAIAANSKGEVYITNWVKRQYPNHGKGEIWRLTNKQQQIESIKLSLEKYRFAEDYLKNSNDRKILKSGDPFEKSVTRSRMTALYSHQELSKLLSDSDSRLRMQALLIFLNRPESLSKLSLERLIEDEDESIRRMTLVYAGTKGIAEMLETFHYSLQYGLIGPDLFDTYLATVQQLQPAFINGYKNNSENHSKNLERELPENFIIDLIGDKNLDELIRAMALPYLEHPEKHLKLLLDLLTEAQEESYQLSLVEVLRGILRISNTNNELEKILIKLAEDTETGDRVRANAIAAMSTVDSKRCQRIKNLLSTSTSVVQYATIKYLCKCRAEEQLSNEIDQWITSNSLIVSPTVLSAWKMCRANEIKPEPKETWAKFVNDHGNSDQGELVYKSRSTQCQTCHRVNGIGGIFGPDLSRIGSSKNRDQLINAVLNPSDEMAPEWQGWFVVDQEGNTHLGRQIDVHLNNVELMNTTGGFDNFPKPRAYGVSNKSVMPEGLQNQMTFEEFNDLIAYLVSLN